MPSITQTLTKAGKISPPSFLPNNVHYECYMGSVAYGVSDVGSDVDVYGFCVPEKDMIFPHLRGEIADFGRQKERFHQFQQHHVQHNDKEYDLSIFSIIKFFHLCMENNPNMIDSLFVPQRCVIHITQLGNIVRENRRLFLHKGAWHKFKGYAYSQLHKMSIKTPQPGSKRFEDVQKHGFDRKFAYHVVRLLNEIEQILIEHDLDLERNSEQLKAIRRGEVNEDWIRRYASDKELLLEKAYTESTLQYKPDEEKIKKLLLTCLEEHYGSLAGAYANPDELRTAFREIRDIVDKVSGKL